MKSMVSVADELESPVQKQKLKGLLGCLDEITLQLGKGLEI